MSQPAKQDLAPAIEDRWPAPADHRAFAVSASAASRERTLRRAILATLVYADLFDYPLTRFEIQRYLVGETRTVMAVAAALDSDPALRPHLGQTGDWFHLTGRRELADVRRDRGAISARLWPVARWYGARISRLPFVRLVGVTGALAMNNARPDDDIDLFVLVQPGRLWLCRLLVLAVVKLAARRGAELCPNFLLSTDHLRLSQRNLFTAHEVAQLVPLAGGGWYDAFVEANHWIADFLPNALPKRSISRASAWGWWPTRVATDLLSTRLLDPIERWEMERKVRRLTGRFEREGGSVAFSAHECRGHFAAHDARVLAAYHARLGTYMEG